VVLHDFGEPGVVEELEPAAGEPRQLIGIDDDVTGGGVAIPEQSFADEQAETL